MDALTKLIANLIEQKVISLNLSLNGEIELRNVLQQLQENLNIPKSDMNEVMGKIDKIMGVISRVC